MIINRQIKGFSRNNVLQTCIVIHRVCHICYLGPKKTAVEGGRLGIRHKHLEAALTDINLYVVATKDCFAFLFWGLRKSFPMTYCLIYRSLLLINVTVFICCCDPECSGDSLSSTILSCRMTLRAFDTLYVYNISTMHNSNDY